MNHTQIEKWLKKHEITNYTIHPNLVVDVKGDVNLFSKKLEALPFQFGKVTGHFWCSDNKLTSLQYCPTTVGGSFYCSNNKLPSLQYCPTTVGGDVWCTNNNLTSLQYCPTTVGGEFNCDFNQLPPSLQYRPNSVKGEFWRACPEDNVGKSEDNVGVSDEDIIGSLREEYVKQVMTGKINNKSFAVFVGDLLTQPQ